VQTLSEIRQLLASVGGRPRKGWGQHFLVDVNLMRKLLELADLSGDETVLEVGSGTGSLTEELLERAGRVVAVELDAALAALLRRRFPGRKKLKVLNCDVLAGKHALAEEVITALAGQENVHLVANLPYSIAVPLVINCLLCSWRWVHQSAEWARAGEVCFGRLTFTIQRELVERLTAPVGSGDYGPATVLVGLLARAVPGRGVSPESFWPRPKVYSQMLRLDFAPDLAGRLVSARALSAVLSATFGHRRKKIVSAAKGKAPAFPLARFGRALAEAGIDPSVRPERVRPEEFLVLANALASDT